MSLSRMIPSEPSAIMANLSALPVDAIEPTNEPLSRFDEALIAPSRCTLPNGHSAIFARRIKYSWQDKRVLFVRWKNSSDPLRLFFDSGLRQIHHLLRLRQKNITREPANAKMRD
ncbi:hypothetical protein [Stenotrophomonas maltophilia]|uniref:hypothetical protein n=1 Tax=Stenotrophomonas maltophilia TaxID=40324 RepID=UPI000D0CB11F|nr:hypothetical protein [Stenotrophomonas maltophilia]PSM13318.1 hypothetical protein CV100_12660 [Stenotrophomonas maltophilia]